MAAPNTVLAPPAADGPAREGGPAFGDLLARAARLRGSAPTPRRSIPAEDPAEASTAERAAGDEDAAAVAAATGPEPGDRRSLERPLQALEDEPAGDAAPALEDEPAGDAAPALEDEPAGDAAPALEDEPAGDAAPALEDEPAGDAAPALEDEPAGDAAPALGDEPAAVGYDQVLAAAAAVLLPAGDVSGGPFGDTDPAEGGPRPATERRRSDLLRRPMLGGTASAAGRVAWSWPRVGSVAVSEADVGLARALRRRLARAGSLAGCGFDGDRLVVSAAAESLLCCDRTEDEEFQMSEPGALLLRATTKKGGDQRCLQ